MNRQEQKEFVESICESLKNSLLKKVADVPENWDGIALRRRVGDYYESHYKEVGTLSGARKKDYKNELSINAKII